MNYDEFQVETFLRTGENEAALRKEYGDPLYKELSRLAQAVGTTPPMLEACRRKVFILPGIMGSRLSVVKDGQADLVWIDPADIATGGIAKLKWLAEASNIVATGTVTVPYMRMRLRLRLAGYDAEFLPYDWRQSPATTGSALMRRIRQQGLSEVTLIGHSMGGLVARQMAAEDPNREVIANVVTIGTPNHGSYAPVQIFDLSHSMLGMVGLVDQVHDKETLARDVLSGFPGLLEMMPSPALRKDEPYFNRVSWPKGAAAPLQAALTLAKKAVAALPAPDDRFHQIIGTGQRTIVAASNENDAHVFTVSNDGDGTVPRDLAEMGDVSRYYCVGAHGGLCNRGDVIAATLDLIATGQTAVLSPENQTAVTQTAPETVSGAAFFAETVRANAPMTEADFAGDFLSGNLEDNGEQSLAATRATYDAADTKPAYPSAIVKAASERWKASGTEREAVRDGQHQARPLQAETTARLDAYTRRLITQLEVASVDGQGKKISRELEKVLAMLERVTAPEKTPPAPMAAVLERVIGQAEEFLSVMFIKRAVVASRAVGRIVTTENGKGFGTGFLIAPGVLMTNQHVLENARAAGRASVQFRYELEIDSREAQGHTFKLDPARLFYADKTLDMAIVAVDPTCPDGTPLDEFGYLPLVGVVGKIRKGQPVNIVQHPLAGRKQVVFRESVLTALPDDSDHVAHYTGDTQPGSSGSPVFSDRWEVIALHHSGVPETSETGRYLTVGGAAWNPNTDPQMNTVNWVANEGIRVSKIVTHLKALPEKLRRADQPGAALVDAVLAVSHRATGTDPFHLPRTSAQRQRETLGQMPEVAIASPNGKAGVQTVTVPLRIQLEFGPYLPPELEFPAAG